MSRLVSAAISRQPKQLATATRRGKQLGNFTNERKSETQNMVRTFNLMSEV